LTDIFSTVFAKPHAFGYIVGVSLPAGKDPVPEKVLMRLEAREATVARSFAGFRQIEWVGGRLAARIAGLHFGAVDWTVLPGRSNEPLAPSGFAVSIAHKRKLAIALVANVADESIGVDLEDDATAAHAIADIVFSEMERARFAELPVLDRDRARVVAFALKEAAYKALAVRLGRALRYRDARVDIASGGAASITMVLDDVESQPDLEVDHQWIDEQVIAAVRTVSRSRPRTPSNTER
jgi:4'-phosphopantetheinyl transferase EntD